ncbi:hypothetical protein ACFVJ9_30495, partial [Streptomyces sp. NPDC127574]
AELLTEPPTPLEAESAALLKKVRVFRRGDALVNRFQFVADHQRRYGAKRLCTLVGIARPTSTAGAGPPGMGPPARSPTPASPPGYGPCATNPAAPTASRGSPLSSATQASASTTNGSRA